MKNFISVRIVFICMILFGLFFPNNSYGDQINHNINDVSLVETVTQERVTKYKLVELQKEFSGLDQEEQLAEFLQAQELFLKEEQQHYSEEYMVMVCEIFEEEQMELEATALHAEAPRVSEDEKKHIYEICEKYGLIEHYEDILSMFSAKTYIYDNEGEYESPLYDIDFPRELQAYTYQMCVENGIPEYYETILSLMHTESRYQYDAVNYNQTCYGIMQIHLVNYGNLSESLGAIDLFDPKDNIRAGIFMLAPYFKKYQDVDKALMAYNHGEYGAKKKWEAGIFETKYTTSIEEVRKNLAKQ